MALKMALFRPEYSSRAKREVSMHTKLRKNGAKALLNQRRRQVGRLAHQRSPIDEAASCVRFCEIEPVHRKQRSGKRRSAGLVLVAEAFHVITTAEYAC